MEVLGWLAAYVLAFGLVQLLLYRHLKRDDPSPEATPSPDGTARRSLDRRTRSGGEGGLRCPHCGAPNEREATFEYCRACVRPLG